jgi:hypothetical protein
MEATPKLRSTTRADAKYLAKVSEVLAQVCAAFEAGKVDGVYIVTREWTEENRPTLNYYRAAMMDMDVSWAAVQTLLSQHLERM